MKLSTIIISYNTKDLTRKCLERVKNSKDQLRKEIIVVDNASSDGSAGMIRKEFPEVALIENRENVGFARANIQAEQIAKGRYILLLNSDAFIKEDTIKKTVDFMEKNTKCGILGVRLVCKDGKVQPSARNFPTPWRFFITEMGLSDKFTFLRGIDDTKFDHGSVRECDWVPGCYFLTRKKLTDDIGFFDKDYFLYSEEIDFCLRAKRNGWKVMFYPETEVMHLGGESAKKCGKVNEKGKQLEKFKLQSKFIYFRKNHGILSVLSYFFFVSLADISQIPKKMIFWKKNIKISDKIKHIKLAYNIMISTRFGGISKD